MLQQLENLSSDRFSLGGSSCFDVPGIVFFSHPQLNIQFDYHSLDYHSLDYHGFVEPEFNSTTINLNKSNSLNHSANNRFQICEPPPTPLADPVKTTVVPTTFSIYVYKDTETKEAYSIYYPLHRLVNANVENNQDSLTQKTQINQDISATRGDALISNLTPENPALENPSPEMINSGSYLSQIGILSILFLLIAIGFNQWLAIRNGTGPSVLTLKSSSNSPPIDLNRATIKELQQVPGIGKSTAEKIDNYRKMVGHIQSVNELQNISGLGAVTVERLKLYFFVAQLNKEDNKEVDEDSLSTPSTQSASSASGPAKRKSPLFSAHSPPTEKYTENDSIQEDLIKTLPNRSDPTYSISETALTGQRLESPIIKRPPNSKFPQKKQSLPNSLSQNKIETQQGGSSNLTKQNSIAENDTKNNPSSKANPASRKKKAVPGKPIDLNTATILELQQLPGIGPITAQKIIEERAKRLFDSVEDLHRVKGIGAKKIAQLRPYVEITSRN